MRMDDEGRRIADEVEHHLEELTRKLMAEGLDPEEARAEALRRFGDPEAVARSTPRVEGDGPLAEWAGDVRRAARALLRAPAFAASAVATLALSTGAVLAVTGVVWDVLLRPLDLSAPDEMVALVERMPETGVQASPASEGTFQDWRRDLGTVRDVVGWEWLTRTLEDPERPAELLSVEVSGDFFEVLGIVPVVGRNPTRADEAPGGTAPAVMLSHAFWMSRFGGDPSVVGRTLPIEGVGRMVVGVAPPRLDLFPDPPALFIPDENLPADPTNRGGRTVHVVARLAPGATVADVSAEVARLGASIAETYPTSARGWTAAAVPLREHLLGEARRPLLVASAAVTLLLLVGVVNLANLLHVRNQDRRREMAIRAALGAGAARIMRITLLEAGLLGLAGGAGGLLLAAGVRSWLAGAEVGFLPRALAGDVPLPWLVGGVVLASVAALAAGAPGAARGARTAIGTLARGTGGATGAAGARARRVLVVAQLAFTAVLLVGAGLLVRTVSALAAVDVGYEPGGVVAARVPVEADRYGSREELQLYFDQLAERVRALPGVEAAGFTSALPMDPVSANFDLPVRSGEMEAVSFAEAPQADFRIVGPGLMEALGFRLVSGRTLDERDRADAPPVALVNRTLADQFWPGEDAVGKRIQSIWRRNTWSEVVGVVEDTRFYGPAGDTRPEIFVPLSQNSWSFMTLAVRTTRPMAEARMALEDVIVRSDPLMPPQEVFEVADLVSASTAPERFWAAVLAGFAALALALAAAGVYGTLAYAVRLRTRELGVRMALGARREGVIRMVVGEGGILAALGLLLGLAASLPATRLVSGMLFGVRPLDPITLVGVALLLGAVAVAACAAPAWRASRVDPVRALREE